MNNDRMGWGDIVRVRRERLSMTQRQLADAAGVSLKTVGNLEVAGVTPQRGTLRKIRESLGLSSDPDVAAVQAREGTGLERLLGAKAVGPVRQRTPGDPDQVLDGMLARIENLEDRVMALERLSDPRSTFRSVANEGDPEPEVEEHP